ncbi:MAG: indole-3-glycerol phosphate synthase TrpC [Candidatus Puniceispirillaceae bacterium]
MSDVLATINAAKAEEVAALNSQFGLNSLAEMAAAGDEIRPFAAALARASQDGYGLIAELKKASPSKGLIRPDFHPAEIAQAYQRGGASCLSVLTDRKWFQGHADYLKAARAACSLPILRKDFMIDPLQIYEARAMGADCILLIMASLGDAQAQELEATAFELGMDVLIEVHDRAELSRATRLKSPLMGINNRNLKTMEISLDVGAAMLPDLPDDRIAIAESGLFAPADLARMASAGARCFLVGESLMRQDDVASATASLLANPIPA